jgi:hypothetical protein
MYTGSYQFGAKSFEELHIDTVFLVKGVMNESYHWEL